MAGVTYWLPPILLAPDFSQVAARHRTILNRFNGLRRETVETVTIPVRHEITALKCGANGKFKVATVQSDDRVKET
jgi:hypothetical protein